MPGTDLVAGDSAVNKRTKFSAPTKQIFYSSAAQEEYMRATQINFLVATLNRS